MIIIPISLGLLLVFGMYEWSIHKKRIKSIPVRVNINGIRGKSTVTRLTNGILKEAGYKTIGKTTGTSARMIYWDKDEEPILRRPEGPNIREQKDVVKIASDLGADALVSECMAVNPDYQIIFQEKMLQANIGVIVNVLEDHLDVMGPTLDQIADAFLATIPHNGTLIVSESPYVDFFKAEAKKRNTNVIVANNDAVSEQFLSQFNYMVFPENAALAFAVAEALEIDPVVAARGMLKATPDPGAMRIHSLTSDHGTGYFINAFAANDPASTINIWNRILEQGYTSKDSIVIMNCRNDRVDRTIQFVEDVLPHLDISTLILIGTTVEPVIQAVDNQSIKVNELLNLEHNTTKEIYQILQEKLNNNVIFGVGNIHGAAEPLINLLVDEES
ncbi:MAG TPA: poly-gamma-glutamate synthase PgsB [Pseudogracilibacillus sp.]|nr:poly-gamma-glutamate synthase PgsB [Pseudogracilibacillus sp.]